MKRFFRYIIALLLLFAVAPSCSDQHSELRSWIDQREQYFDRQLELIKEQEAKLLESDDLRERYDICYKIFDLSRSYKYKIAYKYSNQALKLAREIGDPNLICQAQASKLSTFTSGGLFTEAAEIIKSVSTAGVRDDIKREYYYNVVRYYSDQKDYARNSEHRERYTDQLCQYCDSIISLSATHDYYFTYATAYEEVNNGRVQQAIDVLLEFYGSVECSDHHDSIITFLLGVDYFEIGDEERGFYYLRRSVNHDVRAAARENRSIKTIAQHLFEKGEHRIADELINVAFEDAKFYNARHRNLEINTLLPIINERKIETISRQRNVLYIMVVVVSLLAVLAVILFGAARRRARVIHKSKHTIQQQLNELSQINAELVEANSIKEYYVIESLCKKSDDLKQVESLLKKIDVKVKNRLYDDLHSLYKEFNVKRERENFYSDFDRAFLKLFPNFIEEYNQLFEPQDRIDIEASSDLPPEVRIFALMRLGITDSERISQFLGLSVNTIYTYRTKVKSRSIIPKEEFEQRILNISLSR